MQTDLTVLLDAVVEGGWLPVFGEEYHADGLTELVELETGCADCGHDRCIWDCLGRDLEFTGSKN